MLRILIVEDDHMIREALSAGLKSEGYDVVAVSTLAEAGRALTSGFEGVILDINLPDGSGFDFLENLRRTSKLPVLILTVQGDEDDILRGFSLGADDYITKPFSLRILRARLGSVLRRAGNSPREDPFPLVHDIERQEIRDATGPLDLSPLEYRLMLLFLANLGCTLSRSQLLEKLWDSSGIFVEDNTLSVTVRRLREKLGNRVKIATVRGIGYRLEDNI